MVTLGRSTTVGSYVGDMVVLKTAAYTAAAGEFVKADATGGAFTVTLPASPAVGASVTVKKADASANAVTVVGSGVTTIDGDTNAQIVSQHTSVTFIYDGTNWTVKSTARDIAVDIAVPYQLTARNAIRNGDMGIAQRGNGPFTLAAYTIDGWFTGGNGGTVTTNRVAAGVSGSGMEQGGAAWCLEVATAGQAAAGDLSQIAHRIESVRTYAGKQVTLSFIAKALTGTPSIGVEMIQYFGTGGSPSATVNTAIQAVPISTTATRYSVTFTMPSISGKTIGTTGNDYVMVNLYLSCGSTFAARASNIGIQNNTISVTDVQLEAGVVATPFERISQQDQLAWCQRYFQRFGLGASGTPIASGMSISTVLARFTYHLTVEMRAIPTLVVNGNNYQVRTGPDTVLAVTTVTGHGVLGVKTVGLTANLASGLTAGQAVLLEAVGSSGIDVSAEL
jgi:hypothetical protein